MAPLPRIAFFHGGGSNSSISAVQCAQVQNLLRDEFEFVFFDAPFERSAGPGVLPAFEDERYQPYRTWFMLSEDGTERVDGSGYFVEGVSNGDMGMGEDGIERVLDLMKKDGGSWKGEWVGAMGFSQGTRVVGGLLLDQQRRKEAGLFKKGKGEIEFKFGVLCMGGAAPMVSAISRDGSGSLDTITIPTLHLHGLKDGNLLNGRRQLAEYYDNKTTRLFEIDYHHAMPWRRDDVEGFVDRLREVWNEVK